MNKSINELIVDKFVNNHYYPSIENIHSLIPRKLWIPIRILKYLVEVECNSIVINRNWFFCSYTHERSNIVKEEDISYFIIKTYATNL